MSRIRPSRQKTLQLYRHSAWLVSLCRRPSHRWGLKLRLVPSTPIWTMTLVYKLIHTWWTQAQSTLTISECSANSTTESQRIPLPYHKSNTYILNFFEASLMPTTYALKWQKLPGIGNHSTYEWVRVSDSKKWSSKPYPVSSNSGPNRNLAPASRASRRDCGVRDKFPSKSMAHWFRLHVAIATLKAMINSENLQVTRDIYLCLICKLLKLLNIVLPVSRPNIYELKQK